MTIEENRPAKVWDVSGVLETALEEETYFSSLLSKAAEAGCLPPETLGRIYGETAVLLAEESAAFTHGLSGSLRIESAQELLASLDYLLGLALRRRIGISAQAEALRDVPQATLLAEGRAYLEQILERTRQLTLEVRRTAQPLPNLAYRDTLSGGLGAFLAHYDRRFRAHKLPVTLDYPLSTGRPEGVGAELVERYLEGWRLENQFCRRFPASRVDRVLRGAFGTYEPLLCNVFDAVLAAAAGCMLAEQPVWPLRFDMDDQAVVIRRLTVLTADKRRELLTRTGAALAGEKPLLRMYTVRAAERLADRVQAVLEAGNPAGLAGVFPCTQTL